MNCPHCDHELTEAEIRRLNAQLNRSKAKLPSKRARKERAQKAAAARWGNHKKADT